MIKTIALVILLFSFSLSVLANFNDEVNQYKGVEKQQIADQQSTVTNFSKMSAADVAKSLALVNHFVHVGQHSLQQINPRSGGKADNGAMLFISFSMPKPLIIQMAMQAAHYHIPVILRGLVANSMPKTLQAVLDVKMMAKKRHLTFSGVGIDPVWFTQFSITAVPALVVTHRPQHCIAEKACPNQPYDVIYGNQSIHDSLVQVARDGSALPKKIAAHLLRTGRATQNA